MRKENRISRRRHALPSAAIMAVNAVRDDAERQDQERRAVIAGMDAQLADQAAEIARLRGLLGVFVGHAAYRHRRRACESRRTRRLVSA